jgi:deazaflavin-dependent oxidoreductase (nitroreductase family)
VTARDVKRGLSKGLTVRVANPLVRALIERGLFPTAWCLLETTGRRSGRPRRTPVGDGLRGRAFWVVTEHGWASDYVKNVQADPRVRVKRGRAWLRGTATILPDDDPAARLRWLHRPVNDTALRALGTQQLVVRIDLED